MLDGRLVEQLTFSLGMRVQSQHMLSWSLGLIFCNPLPVWWIHSDPQVRPIRIPFRKDCHMNSTGVNIHLGVSLFINCQSSTTAFAVS